MNIVDLSFHLAPPAILGWLAIIFVRRGIQREFPLFFAYLLYVPVATALRISVTGRAIPYYWLYWITEAIYAVAEMLVIREVLQHIHAIHYKSSPWFRLILPATVLVILGITLWQTIYHPLGHRISWAVSATYWFDLGVHLLEGTILFLLVVIGAVLPTDWMKREYGILTGFGLAATVTLLAYLARFAGGSRYELFFRYGPPAGYIAASLIWLHAFVRPVAQGPRVQGDADEMGTEISKSKAFLDKLRKKGHRQQAAGYSRASSF
jgi:hypothetical protein